MRWRNGEYTRAKLTEEVLVFFGLVVFQPCELEPTANKHKFMVQALYIPDGEINLEETVSLLKLLTSELEFVITFHVLI